MNIMANKKLIIFVIHKKKKMYSLFSRYNNDS